MTFQKYHTKYISQDGKGKNNEPPAHFNAAGGLFISSGICCGCFCIQSLYLLIRIH